MKGVLAKHGRVVRIGQIWRANDTRRLRGVRVISIDVARRRVAASDIVSQRAATIPLRNFTTGRDGWSLEKEVFA